MKKKQIFYSKFFADLKDISNRSLIIGLSKPKLGVFFSLILKMEKIIIKIKSWLP